MSLWGFNEKAVKITELEEKLKKKERECEELMWSHKKQMEQQKFAAEKKQMEQQKFAAEKKLEELRATYQRKLHDAENVWKDQINELKVEHAEKFAEAKTSASEDALEKLKEGLLKMNTEGNQSTKFMHDLALKMFDKAPMLKANNAEISVKGDD